MTVYAGNLDKTAGLGKNRGVSRDRTEQAAPVPERTGCRPNLHYFLKCCDTLSRLNVIYSES